VTITLIILSIVLSILSGFFKAICDTSEEGVLKFKNTFFWIKDLSWRNKWKNQDRKQGEAFWGSSRWFVSFTDGWHLFGMLFRLVYAKLYICIGLLISVNIWYSFSGIVAYILFAVSFHLFYNSKLLRK